VDGTTKGFIRLAGGCAILAPWLQGAAGLMQFVPGLEFEWTVVFFFAFVLYVPAIIGLTLMAVRSGSRLAALAGALAYFGAMAGAGMQAFFRSGAVLLESGQAAGRAALGESFPLAASTMFIGIFFPIGLLLLAVCLYLSRAVPRLAAVLLAVGAVAFPVGHAIEIDAAQVAASVLMIAAFGMIGLAMIRRTSSEEANAQ
jgi:hypothetical protein